MTKKFVLVTFNGEPMCFAHVLLNALDMKEKGYDVKVVVEGAATKLLNKLNNDEEPFGKLFLQVKDKGIIDCVCHACSIKMGTFESAKDQGLPMCNDMMGHPPLSGYLEQGYQIITF